MIALTNSLGHRSSVADFDRLICAKGLDANIQLWFIDNTLVAYAALDEQSALWFEIDPKLDPEMITAEILAWAFDCVKDNPEPMLNSCTWSMNTERIRLLETNGFTRQSAYTLNYSRPLTGLIEIPPLPRGFTCRAVRGESEAQQMVELQHAAFKTDFMTLETRLAQMRAPGYCPTLDLVITAPDGRLAAFCFCSLERAGLQKTGFTEPIGTHPDFRKHSLAKVLLATTLHKLNEMGYQSARLSTSMENLAMQHLAASLGFMPDNALIWYSKAHSPEIRNFSFRSLLL